MSTKNGYLLRFVGDSLKGRGLKLYLFNDSTGRNDLEAILPDKDFDETYSVLSWPFVSEGSYTLNLETRSFGRQKAENVVDKIAIYQVPTEWLAGWYIEPSVNKFGIREVGGALNNDVEVIDVNKIGTYRYNADIKGYGVILLSQGYDSGWIAYENNGTIEIFYSFNDATDGDIGRLSSIQSSDAFDDDYYSAVAGGSVLNKDVPHPLAIADNNIMYIPNRQR